MQSLDFAWENLICLKYVQMVVKFRSIFQEIVFFTGTEL